MVKYCDLDCRYAKFPKKLSDGSASCRTFLALQCSLKKIMVYKNAVCKFKVDRNRANKQIL